MTDRQALLSAAGKQRPYKAVNIKPPAMPGDIYLWYNRHKKGGERHRAVTWHESLAAFGDDDAAAAGD